MTALEHLKACSAIRLSYVRQRRRGPYRDMSSIIAMCFAQRKGRSEHGTRDGMLLQVDPKFASAWHGREMDLSSLVTGSRPWTFGHRMDQASCRLHLLVCFHKKGRASCTAVDHFPTASVVTPDFDNSVLQQLSVNRIGTIAVKPSLPVGWRKPLVLASCLHSNPQMLRVERR